MRRCEGPAQNPVMAELPPTNLEPDERVAWCFRCNGPMLVDDDGCLGCQAKVKP